MLENVLGNVVVQLEQDDVAQGVVVVLRGVVVDVRFGGGVQVVFAAGGGRLDALVLLAQRPPLGVELVGGQLVGVEAVFPFAHHARREGDEHHVAQRFFEQLLRLVGFGVGRNQAQAS